MIYTIYTDASYHFSTKIAGVGFWIKCDDWSHKGGTFFQNVEHSAEAELLAACYGIISAANKIGREFNRSDLIILNSDCMYVVELFNGQKNKMTDRAKAAKEKSRIALAKARIRTRHVKAHSFGQGVRSHVNNYCDKEAKRWSRVALRQRS